MRYPRTVGPPSKPGHGRGSAPYGRSDSTSRPWGGASWTVEKQRASCKSLSWTRSWTLSNVAWLVNISWIALVTSLPARAFTWTLASTPTKPTIQSNSKDRRHNSKEPRIQRLQTRGEPFLWRHAATSTYHVFQPESTRKRTNQPTWFPRTKTRATHLKETKQLPTCFLSTSKYL